MKKIQIFMVFILLSFLLLGCATTPTFRSKCAAKALYAAMTIGLQEDPKIPVRIAYGTTSNPGTTHVQAQAFIDGKWEFLKIIGPDEVGIGKKYKSFTIKRYVSVETFSKWLIFWLKNESLLYKRGRWESAGKSRHGVGGEASTETCRRAHVESLSRSQVHYRVRSSDPLWPRALSAARQVCVDDQ